MAVSIFDNTVPDHTSPDSALLADERDRLLREAVERLPDDQREAVVMKLYAGLTFSQIAQAVGEPLTTVSSRYRRALERLKSELELPV